jgi:hypothetical protein
MTSRRAVTLSASLVLAFACTHSPATSSPAPVSTTAATPAPSAAAGPPRRVPPSRDSVDKLRAAYVTQVMASIAGRENQPADQVFKNVQVLKNLTAAQLVQTMDKEYGRAMTWNCTNCHRLAPQGNWASDTSADKKRARFMQTMTNEINQNQLPKLYPKDTPKISCMTCHRGYNEPPNDQYMIPERGKPGGLPLPPARGQSGPPAAGTTPPRPPLH